MTAFIYSAVHIVPTVQRENADKVGWVMDYAASGTPIFVAELSATGNVPATHYAYRAQEDQIYMDLMTAAFAGTLPDADWASEGLTEADVHAVLAASIWDTSTELSGTAHFDAVIQTNGLQRVTVA